MNDQCICIERIGDNGPCPVHGAGYASGAASLFASIARGEERCVCFEYAGDNGPCPMHVKARNEMGIPIFFLVGWAKYYLRGDKFYVPTLSKLGQTKYSLRKFRTATKAREYAERWARRADRMIGGTNA